MIKPNEKDWEIATKWSDSYPDIYGRKRVPACLVAKLRAEKEEAVEKAKRDMARKCLDIANDAVIGNLTERQMMNKLRRLGK